MFWPDAFAVPLFVAFVFICLPGTCVSRKQFFFFVAHLDTGASEGPWTLPLRSVPGTTPNLWRSHLTNKELLGHTRQLIKKEHATEIKFYAHWICWFQQTNVEVKSTAQSPQGGQLPASNKKGGRTCAKDSARRRRSRPTPTANMSMSKSDSRALVGVAGKQQSFWDVCYLCVWETPLCYLEVGWDSSLDTPWLGLGCS